jgi:flagellar FliL protein
MATKSAASAAPSAATGATSANGGAAAAGASAAPAAPAPVPVASAGVLSAWLPAIATILLAPVATWTAVEFVVLPQMQKKLTAPPAAEGAAHAAETSDGHGGKAGKDKAPPGYEFSNVVVNLAGTMGTRYLKTSFIVTGPDAGIKGVFEGDKPRLTDVTLNVLSSLSLADLEEPGAKNVLREKLVVAYNQALGRKVAEQVYFSDFVIQ